MRKLREENVKLASRYKRLKGKYLSLRKEIDDNIANKLSLTIGKAGFLVTAGIALGRFLK